MKALSSLASKIAPSVLFIDEVRLLLMKVYNLGRVLLFVTVHVKGR